MLYAFLNYTELKVHIIASGTTENTPWINNKLDN